MVFSSVPPYLDPSNWQQHQIVGSSGLNPLLAPTQPAPPPPPPPPSHGGSLRPGSMSERARLANVPMPETALKCPRCESTNTKFCYFNNYSLTQPRHFCKTCRRYWTRGGALRNVPVGGGCRRNKRSKSASSKSPASGERQTAAASSTSSAVSTNGGADNLLGLTPQLPSLRFMSPLGGQFSDNYTGDMVLNYGGISAPSVGASEMNFHGSSSLLGGGGGIEAWRLQQFPFLGGLDPSPPGIYPFHGGESGLVGGETGHLQVRPKLSSSLLLNQLASVKMEENPELNQSTMAPAGNEQWNGSAAWTELSGFSSSSTGNPLR